MKLPIFLAATAALVTVAAAQDRPMTFKDVMNFVKYPESIAPKDIPADFRAVRIKQPTGGGGGLMDMLGGGMFMMFGMLGSMGGSTDKDGPSFEFLSALDLSWTNGDELNVSGSVYLVTYKLEIGIAEMTTMDSKTPPPLDLKLVLVRADSITSFAVDRAVTKEKYIAALAKRPKPAAPATPPKPDGDGGGGGKA